MKTKKRKRILGICLLLLVLTSGGGLYLLVNNVRERYKIENMRKALQDEGAIIFSADLAKGESGLFLYHPGENRLECISEEWSNHEIHDITYHKNRTKILTALLYGSRAGIWEYDMEKASWTPVIERRDLATYFKREKIAHPYNPFYFGDDYLFELDNVLYRLSKDGDEWDVSIVHQKDDAVEYFVFEEGEGELLVESGVWKEFDKTVRYDKYNPYDSIESVISKGNLYKEGTDAWIRGSDFVVAERSKKIIQKMKKSIWICDMQNGEFRCLLEYPKKNGKIETVCVSASERYVFYRVYTVHVGSIFSYKGRRDFYVADIQTGESVCLWKSSLGDYFMDFAW